MDEQRYKRQMKTIRKQELFPDIKQTRIQTKRRWMLKKNIQYVILVKIKWKLGLKVSQADKTSLATYAKLNLVYACETYIGSCK